MRKKHIRILTANGAFEIDLNTIIYILMEGNQAFVHTSTGEILQTRKTLDSFEREFGENFIRVKRGCLVSVTAIHDIGDRVNLLNGESLDYAIRRRKEFEYRFKERQKIIISEFKKTDLPANKDEYKKYYAVFDNLPIAFADIEMVFDDHYHAVDWVFRYGNEALAKLEKLPLRKLINKSFRSLFPNMDEKWLKSYERATLHRETLKIIDHSPEIDTYLDIICFPTFEGHCGCILFDVSQLKGFRQATETEKTLSFFVEKILNVK